MFPNEYFAARFRIMFVDETVQRRKKYPRNSVRMHRVLFYVFHVFSQPTLRARSVHAIRHLENFSLTCSIPIVLIFTYNPTSTALQSSPSASYLFLSLSYPPCGAVQSSTLSYFTCSFWPPLNLNAVLRRTTLSSRTSISLSTSPPLQGFVATGRSAISSFLYTVSKLHDLKSRHRTLQFPPRLFNLLSLPTCSLLSRHAHPV